MKYHAIICINKSKVQGGFFNLFRANEAVGITLVLMFHDVSPTKMYDIITTTTTNKTAGNSLIAGEDT